MKAIRTRAERLVNAADLFRQIGKDVNIEQIQGDGGTAFRGTFEAACKQIGLQLLALPPSSPKLNGHIESVNSMMVRELPNFKGVYDHLDKTAETSDCSCPTTTRCEITRLSDSKHTTIGSSSQAEEITRFYRVLSIATPPSNTP